MKRVIGIFDSGIGGFDVARKISALLPHVSIHYIAAKEHFPFSRKSPEEIRKIADEVVSEFYCDGIGVIVIACNTATAYAIDYLRAKYSDVSFIGMEPAVKPASQKAKKGILVLSSEATAKSTRLKTLMSTYAKDIKYYLIGSTTLIEAVERGYDEKRILNVLSMEVPHDVRNKIDVVVLGCSHFSWIAKEIQQYFGKDIAVIDSSDAVAARVKNEYKI